jgi:hypothetical protein
MPGLFLVQSPLDKSSRAEVLNFSDSGTHLLNFSDSGRHLGVVGITEFAAYCGLILGRCDR